MPSLCRPDNVMVNSEGAIKVIDFGLSNRVPGGGQGPVTLFHSISLVFPLFVLLVHSGRSRYRPWRASLRSAIVPSVAGGVLLSET